MSQRLERVSGEVRAILGEVLARDEIKDPRVRGAGLITVTHVRVSGDLRHAWASFTVHDLHAAGLEVVRQGLNNASGYFRQAIARRLRMKVAPAVKFEVDTVFEQAERVEKLLREDAAARAAAPVAAASEEDDGERPRPASGRDRLTDPLDAVLVVDKPIGLTSFDVVRRVRHAAGARRVGHGGTLDPAATGVLPVCLGEATKLAQFLLDADKQYDFTVCFGVETDTDDAAGSRHRAPRRDRRRRGRRAARAGAVPRPDHAGAAQLLGAEAGGRPLYDYARAGEPVEAAPRGVVVHELELTSFAGPAAVGLTMRCSKGTYVRALARDLGRALGVGAHVTALRRTRSGPFALADARPLDEVLAALAAGDLGVAAAGRARGGPAAPAAAGRDGRRGARRPLRPPHSGGDPGSRRSHWR